MSPADRECLVADFCTAAINGDLNTLEECCFIRFVDVEATDRNGWRAIHHAASYGHVHIVQGLVQKLRVDVNSRNSEGFTALHFACGNNYLNVVRCLVLDCRCNISLSTVGGFTALDIARQLGNSDMVQFLEQHSLKLCQLNPETR
jgi:ankyrin repeat protein